MRDNLTSIEDGKIHFKGENEITDLIEYCEFECREKCNGSGFLDGGIECDCVVNRLYWAMVRLAEIEHGWVPNES